MSKQWFMGIGGRQVGPVGEGDIRTNLQNGSVDSRTLVWTEGMSGWTAIGEVPEFASAGVPPPLGGPPPLSATPTGQAPSRSEKPGMVDYEVHGHDLQFVELALEPRESIVAEAGAMMYMTDGIEMQTIFGDGSGRSKGFMDALLGAGKRLITGESLFMTVFENKGAARARVAFAAPYAGLIVPLDMKQLGGEILCQKDAFLCALRGISIGIAFQKRIGVGLFGGEGFILQRLKGDTLAFLHGGGTIHAVELARGERLRVDTGCLVAFQPSVDYDIQFVGGIKTALFGGEGLFFAQLTGPGRVWLQSLPLSRLADRIYKAAPQSGGRRVGEGSILDRAFGLGNVLDGD